MNIFARIGNLFKGFLSLFVKSAEEANPTAVYEVAIQEHIKKHKKLKKAISGIVYLRNKTQHELEELVKELEEIDYQLEAALESNEDELATLLIEQQDKLTTSIKDKSEELESITQQAEDSKLALQQFQGQVEKLRREKEEMIAKVETAEARIKIQESLDGLSLDADIQALDNVRESIHKKVAEADVNAEMSGASLKNKMENLKEKGSAIKARRKLEELKAARNSSKAKVTLGASKPVTGNKATLENIKKAKEALNKAKAVKADAMKKSNKTI